jgi:hypothetical protein
MALFFPETWGLPVQDPHDLLKSRRYEKHGTAQNGLKGTPTKDGLRLGARPGGKDLLDKNHEAPSISWPGGPPNCGMSIAECGLKKKTPKSEIRNSKSPMERPMLFVQKVLAPGPQPKDPGTVKLYGSLSRAGDLL